MDLLKCVAISGTIGEILIRSRLVNRDCISVNLLALIIVLCLCKTEEAG